MFIYCIYNTLNTEVFHFFWAHLKVTTGPIRALNDEIQKDGLNLPDLP